jgi:triacylglycerol esterase/lipase EstA (alpha/beta hydrolase family)
MGRLAPTAAVVAVLLVVVTSAVAQPAGAGRVTPSPSADITYVAPVDGRVIDRFRAPEHPYGPGNRGLDYRTPPGSLVRASAEGRVVFAGPVGGTLHATIAHPDGLRTSYSFLDGVDVRVGQLVDQGDLVGTAGHQLHFGVRDADGNYLDPDRLIGRASRRGARLVPGVDEGRPPLEERRALLDVVREQLELPVDVVESLVAAGSERAVVLAHYVRELQPAVRLARVADGLDRWLASRADCTPRGLLPPRPPGRRIAVLVGGLGSNSDAAGVDQVDVDALGYDQGDVIRFSYRGGRVPATDLAVDLDALADSTYGPADTHGDLEQAARRLEQLLVDLERLAPGTPVDLIAHSQGGVVARLALGRAHHQGSLPADVATLVTIGTPHGGSDLATALTAVRQVGGLDRELDDVSRALGLGHDPASVAVAQLAETSTLIEQLGRASIPEHVGFVSIAAELDLVVAAPRTLVAGERAVSVPLTGLTAHDALPGAADTTREIALAIAGAGPTCVELGSALRGIVVGEAVSFQADSMGAAAAAVGVLTPRAAVALAPSPGGP